MVKNLPAMQETQVQSLGQKDMLDKGMVIPLVFLPGEFHGQRHLVGYSPLGSKELDATDIHSHSRKISHHALEQSDTLMPILT